jgi:hypothetical protein
MTVHTKTQRQACVPNCQRINDASDGQSMADRNCQGWGAPSDMPQQGSGATV